MKHNKKFLLIALSLLLVSPLTLHSVQASVMAGSNIAVTDTSYGRLQGYQEDGVAIYKGIPYATAERFMPPKDISSWQGTKMALDYGPIVPQEGFPSPSTYYWPRLASTEDEAHGLSLNIWAPETKGKKAVMVWLHGGGFSTGSAVDLSGYDGTNLAKNHDVVVVTLNHRLNVLGYLNLSKYGPEYKDSANVGIMDIVSALRWIHNNIASFGGDPENVTLFGQSGGGAKVLTLMATPAAQGLFQKGIVESGAVEKMGMNLFTPELGQEIAARTFKNLGIPEGDVNALQKVPYDELAAASDKALQDIAEERKIPDVLDSSHYKLYWMPTTDGFYIPEEPVGTKYPAMAKNIPLLIGTNLTEWETVPLMNDPGKYQYDTPSQWTEAERNEKLAARFGNDAAAVEKAFKKAYPDKNPGEAAYAETLLRKPALHTARLKAAQNGAPVYNYVFTWDTPSFNSLAASYHTAEIPFVFDDPEKESTVTGNTKEAKALAHVMSTAWTNFAKTGNPNGEGVPKWEPFTNETEGTMIFDNTSYMAYGHDKDLIAAIDKAEEDKNAGQKQAER